MPWFVGRTRPCWEHLAQRQIERHFGQLTAPQWNKAEYTYLPMFFDLKNRRHRCLFTSWLFIRQCQPYVFLFHIEALAYILMSDGHQSVAPQRGQARPGTLPLRRFDAGETVRVAYGPLKDQEVVYQGMSVDLKCAGRRECRRRS
jgi:hypothetical protein